MGRTVEEPRVVVAWGRGEFPLARAAGIAYDPHRTRPNKRPTVRAGPQ
jgi:hypothetical protein